MDKEEKQFMIDFIKRTYGKVDDSKLQTDEDIRKIYNEAVNDTDWSWGCDG